MTKRRPRGSLVSPGALRTEMQGLARDLSTLLQAYQWAYDWGLSQYSSPPRERVTMQGDPPTERLALWDKSKAETRAQCVAVAEAVENMRKAADIGKAAMESLFGKPVKIERSPKADWEQTPAQLKAAEEAKQRRESRGEGWGAA